MNNQDAPRILHGRTYLAANGFIVYSIDNAGPEIIEEMGRILVSKFNCTPIGSLLHGLDSIIGNCHQGEIELGIGWDIWFGFHILSNSLDGDLLVEEIAMYLDTIITREEFERYIDQH